MIGMWGIGVTLIALNESPSEKEGKSGVLI